MQAWQDVLWREWRHTNDEAYARHLFELVVAVPLFQLATYPQTRYEFCNGLLERWSTS